MITKKDLEKAGIVYLGNNFHPDKFFIPQVGEIHLYEPYKWEDIFEKIYYVGHKNGAIYGEHKKIDEIKRVLQIEDCQSSAT